MIQSRYTSLSAKERQIADFILAHPDEAVHPSIEELSQRIGTSESTMVRFAKKLGYSGYQRFRIALAQETIPPAQQLFEAEVKKGDDVAALVFEQARSNLEQTYALLDKKTITKASTLIAQSNALYLMGLGGSNIIAQDAYHKLIRTGLNCHWASDFHIQLMEASQAQEGDVALIISHTGSGWDTLALAEELKERGAHLIVLTSNQRSPLAKAADLVLAVSAGHSPVVAESFSARITSLVLIDVLYIEVLELLGERGITNLHKMRSVIAKRRR